MWLAESKRELLYDEVAEIQKFTSLQEFEVSDYRARHLAPSRIGGAQTSGVRCPAGQRLQTDCFCEEYGPLFGTKPKRGFFILIAPAKGVENSLKEMDKFVDCLPDVLGLRCLYAHSGKTYRNVNAERLTRENAWLLQSDPATGLPPPRQTRYLLIMSEQAYNLHVKRIIAREPPADVNARCSIDFLPGNIFRDEHHEIKGPGSYTVQHIVEMKKHAQSVADKQVDDENRTDVQRSVMPWIWAISGTPWTSHFDTLQGIITCIEQPWWASTQDLQHCTMESIKGIAKRTQALSRRSLKIEQLDDVGRRQLAVDVATNGKEMKAVLDQLEIRRTSRSKNMVGEPMVELPPHELRRCFCDNTEAQQRALDALDATLLSDMKQAYLKAKETAEAKGEPVPPANWDSYFARVGKLKAATVVPELLALARELELDLTSNELVRHGWMKDPHSSPYKRHLTRLTRDTPKLLVLADIVRRLKTDVDGRPEKLIVYASTPVVCLIVSLVSDPAPRQRPRQLTVRSFWPRSFQPLKSGGCIPAAPPPSA